MSVTFCNSITSARRNILPSLTYVPRNHTSISSPRNFSSNNTLFTSVSHRSSSASKSTFRGPISMAAPIEVLVKGAIGNPSKLGDCPFSQRVLLTLEEKHVEYSFTPIDVVNKPAWFLEVNPEGKVPVIKYNGKWIPDSDVIVDIIEKDFPEPSLATPPEVASAGSKLFGAFVKFLKSSDSEDGTEDVLLSELQNLNSDLEKIPGPFIAGDKVSAVDLSLAPKLYALKVGARRFKEWSIPERFTNVLSYIQALEGLESFKKTAAPEEYVISGWGRALGR